MMNKAITEVTYPKSFMERFHSYARTQSEATWHCPTCGPIPGRAVTLHGETRYGPMKCACQITEDARRQQQERHNEWARDQIILTYSWLGSRWEDTALATKTFDTFNAHRQPEGFEATRMFVTDTKGALVLHGSVGTGKTHLLAALCNELRNAHRGSLFTTAPKLFAAINGRISTREDYSDLITRALRTPLLVLDDIDKAKHSDFREEIYYELVDERVKRGLPIALSTNRLDDLASYVGPAVCSRLQIGQIAVPMYGDDYRRGMEAI